MNPNQQDLKLLPRYFNKIAWGLLAVPVLIMVLSKLEVFTIDKEWGKVVTQNMILVSLLLFAMTKGKIEDELTMRIRLKAFAASFVFGVSMVIVSPVIDFLVSGDASSDLGTIQLLLSMFFFYFIMYFILKKQR